MKQGSLGFLLLLSGSGVEIDSGASGVLYLVVAIVGSPSERVLAFVSPREPA